MDISIYVLQLWMESGDIASSSADRRAVQIVCEVSAREEMWSGWGKARSHASLKITVEELKPCPDGILGLLNDWWHQGGILLHSIDTTKAACSKT